MKKLFVFVFVFVFVCLGVNAKTKKKKPVAVKPTAEELRFNEMLPNTARIMFIDSLVVDKAQFLKYMPFSSDMGRMVVSKGNCGYINEFDDTEIMAHGDTIKGRNLYMAHRFGKEWNDNKELPELKSSFSWVDYPFLRADGITLYYSARGGEESFGELDLYKSTYDADGSKFYEPANMGLPFSSLANDYFLCISDADNLGWLVSDRNQPQDKVCIYTFEPTKERQSFSEETPQDSLEMYARITSIKDTWKFGDRKAALERLEALKNRITEKTDKEETSIHFVVNDNTVYSSEDEFRSPEGKQKYRQLLSLRKQYETNQRLLEVTRKTHSELPKVRRRSSAQQILDLEKQQEKLQKEITNLEKSIRKDEISRI